MNTFVFDGSWNQVKGVLRQKFAQLRDADLDFIQGKGEELLGRIQTQLGLNREEVEIMLDNVQASVAEGALAAQDKFAQVTAKVSEMAGQWKNRAGAVASDIAAKASAGFAGGVIYEGRRRIFAIRETTKDHVRRKPREALVSALAVGFVIGLMLHRD